MEFKAVEGATDVVGGEMEERLLSLERLSDQIHLQLTGPTSAPPAPTFDQVSRLVKMAIVEKRALDVSKREKLRTAIHLLQRNQRAVDHEQVMTALKDLEPKTRLQFSSIGSDAFLSCKAYYFEVKCRAAGDKEELSSTKSSAGVVADVLLHHTNKSATNTKETVEKCDDLLQLIDSSDWPAVVREINGIRHFYPPELSTKDQCDAFERLRCLENDVIRLSDGAPGEAKRQICQPVSNRFLSSINDSLAGLARRRSGAAPLRAFFFATPYDFLSENTGKPVDVYSAADIVKENIGCWYEVDVVVTPQEEHPLQCDSLLLAQTAQLDSAQPPLRSVFTETTQSNTAPLAALFRLKFSRRICMLKEDLLEIETITGCTQQAVDEGHLLSLMVNEDKTQSSFRSKLRSRLSVFHKFLPDQAHKYMLDFEPHVHLSSAVALRELQLSDVRQLVRCLPTLRRNLMLANLLDSCRPNISSPPPPPDFPFSCVELTVTNLTRLTCVCEVAAAGEGKEQPRCRFAAMCVDISGGVQNASISIRAHELEKERLVSAERAALKALKISWSVPVTVRAFYMSLGLPSINVEALAAAAKPDTHDGSGSGGWQYGRGGTDAASKANDKSGGRRTDSSVPQPVGGGDPFWLLAPFQTAKKSVGAAWLPYVKSPAESSQKFGRRRPCVYDVVALENGPTGDLLDQVKQLDKWDELVAPRKKVPPAQQQELVRPTPPAAFLPIQADCLPPLHLTPPAAAPAARQQRLSSVGNSNTLDELDQIRKMCENTPTSPKLPPSAIVSSQRDIDAFLVGDYKAGAASLSSSMSSSEGLFPSRSGQQPPLNYMSGLSSASPTAGRPPLSHQSRSMDAGAAGLSSTFVEEILRRKMSSSSDVFDFENTDSAEGGGFIRQQQQQQLLLQQQHEQQQQQFCRSFSEQFPQPHSALQNPPLAPPTKRGRGRGSRGGRGGSRAGRQQQQQPSEQVDATSRRSSAAGKEPKKRGTGAPRRPRKPKGAGARGASNEVPAVEHTAPSTVSSIFPNLPSVGPLGSPQRLVGLAPTTKQNELVQEHVDNYAARQQQVLQNYENMAAVRNSSTSGPFSRPAVLPSAPATSVTSPSLIGSLLVPTSDRRISSELNSLDMESRSDSNPSPDNSGEERLRNTVRDVVGQLAAFSKIDTPAAVEKEELAKGAYERNDCSQGGLRTSLKDDCAFPLPPPSANIFEKIQEGGATEGPSATQASRVKPPNILSKGSRKSSLDMVIGQLRKTAESRQQTGPLLDGTHSFVAERKPTATEHSVEHLEEQLAANEAVNLTEHNVYEAADQPVKLVIKRSAGVAVTAAATSPSRRPHTYPSPSADLDWQVEQQQKLPMLVSALDNVAAPGKETHKAAVKQQKTGATKAKAPAQRKRKHPRADGETPGKLAKVMTPFDANAPAMAFSAGRTLKNFKIPKIAEEMNCLIPSELHIGAPAKQPAAKQKHGASGGRPQKTPVAKKSIHSAKPAGASTKNASQSQFAPPAPTTASNPGGIFCQSSQLNLQSPIRRGPLLPAPQIWLFCSSGFAPSGSLSGGAWRQMAPATMLTSALPPASPEAEDSIRSPDKDEDRPFQPRPIPFSSLVSASDGSFAGPSAISSPSPDDKVTFSSLSNSQLSATTTSMDLSKDSSDLGEDERLLIVEGEQDSEQQTWLAAGRECS